MKTVQQGAAEVRRLLLGDNSMGPCFKQGHSEGRLNQEETRPNALRGERLKPNETNTKSVARRRVEGELCQNPMKQRKAERSLRGDRTAARGGGCD